MEYGFHGNAGLWRWRAVPGECQTPLNFLCVLVPGKSDERGSIHM